MTADEQEDLGDIQGCMKCEYGDDSEHIDTCPNTTPKETVNMPDGKEVPLLKHEDGVPWVHKLSDKEEDGFARIHDWDSYTREVLNNILVAVENKQALGYFDSLIDVETNCKLISMARAVYINQFNDNSDGSRFKNPHTKITKEDIDKQCRGGYSTEFKERMYKLLINDGDTNG